MNRTSVFRAGLLAAAVSGAVATSHAQDVFAYGVLKGHLHTQTSASAPQAEAAPFQILAYVEGYDIIDASITAPPLGQQLVLGESLDGSRFEQSFSAATAAQLNQVFGSGQYRFTIDTANDGLSLPELTLDSSTFPVAIPHVSNFTAAQQIDHSQDFTLTFNAFTGATGDDYFELEVIDPDGYEVYSTQGTPDTAVTIPADYLWENTRYTARLRFVHVTELDVTSYPGATGTAGLYTETEFNLTTAGEGGGGGGDDTTAPALASTNPENGATEVETSFIMFTFNEAMAESHSIQWSGNVNAGSLIYNWADPRTLIVASMFGFPQGATITWTLNPGGAIGSDFQDLAGNPLPQISGSFTTVGGGDPNDPCNPNPPDNGLGFGSINKSVHYTQTGNNTPVFDPEMGAIFSGVYRAASNQVVNTVTVTGPNGFNATLENNFGFFIGNQEFPSVLVMDAAVPAGTYTITANGAGTANVTIGSPAQIPVPRILNLEELNAMDVTKDFTLQFAPFTGAGAIDSISISINGIDGGGEFHAPDFCLGIELPNTATSVVIPANTFEAAQEFTGSIMFSRTTTHDSNSIPSTSLTASVSTTTTFGFDTGGGGENPRQPMWSTITRRPDGTLAFTITGDTGLTVVIEGTTDLDGWTEVSTHTLTTGSQEIVVDPRSAHHRFYRARVD